ncbi:MAG TPA: hypothetical protein VFY65_04565, partial [Longimicrobium sp.]|nr:hypothetical protein [Longimicrobium sp.]
MKAIAALLTIASLAACASAAPPVVDPSASTGPLKAELTEDDLGARVRLTAPAYVALFHVRPGAGASLVYPRDASEPALLAAGQTRIVPRRPTRGTAALQGSPDGYLYLVASKLPLEVEQFQTGSRSVRDVIGIENDRSNDLAVITEAIDLALMSTDATVAGPWTSALLTPWQRVTTRTASRGGRGGRSSIVDCPNGSTEIVGATSRSTCGGPGRGPGVATTPAERRANRPNAGATG